MLKKTVNAAFGAAMCVGLAMSGGAASAAEQWSMAASWGGGPFLKKDAEGFAKLVDIMTDGNIKIQVFPAGTLGKALKVSDTVKSGVAEAGHTWMGYDWGVDKATVIFAGMAGGLQPEELMLWLFQGRGAAVRVPHGEVRRGLDPLRYLPHGDFPALQEAYSEP